MPEIFQYEFMIRAFIGGALVGVTAPALGMFLVLRRLALIADSLSHVALAGVAIGLLTQTFPPVVGLGATSVAAVAIETVRLKKLMPGDAALAVVLYSALAVAVVIISLADGFNVGLFGYLFGSILTVNLVDLWLLGGLTLIVLAYVMGFYSELSQSSFDPDLAQANGVHVFRINIVLAILTGATIALSMRMVGVLLVGALIVVPVMVSLRLATGLKVAIGVAIAVGIGSALLGLTVSFYADVAAGGTIVLTAVSVLMITMAASSLAGKLSSARRSGA